MPIIKANFIKLDLSSDSFDKYLIAKYNKTAYKTLQNDEK